MAPPQVSRWEKAASEFRTDGSRVSHRASSWLNLAGKGKPRYKSFLWDGKRFIQYRQTALAKLNRVFISDYDAEKKRMIATEYKGRSAYGDLWRRL